MDYKKNKDGYYRATFVIGKTPDGKPDRIIVRDKNKEIFKKKLAEAKRLHSKGVVLDDITVYEWAQRWLKVYKGKSSPELQAHFKAKMELDIIPIIGNMRMKDVRASHLQELLNNCTDKKYGTVVKIRIAIKQLFDAAETEGIIERNPATKLELPNDLEEEERRPLTETERSVVWDVAQTHPHGTYILTMLLCGLRRGECVALTVDKIDFNRKRLIIRNAIRYNSNKGRVKSPKSEAGVREVPIPDILLSGLRKHCEDKSEKTYVFTKVDGTRATETAVKWWWNSFQRQCHIKAGAKLYRNKILIETSPFDDKVSPHYFRHTYSTDLYAAGVDEKAQKYFMGHKSNDVTDVYRKMNDEAFDRAAELINKYFSKKYPGNNDDKIKK